MEFMMKTQVYRFTFISGTDLTEAELTLRMAFLAAEGLVGESRVRMEASYHVDSPRLVILVDGGTCSGDAIVRIFTAFVTHEFGGDAFTVRPVVPAAASRAHAPHNSLGAAA